MLGLGKDTLGVVVKIGSGSCQDGPRCLQEGQVQEQGLCGRGIGPSRELCCGVEQLLCGDQETHSDHCVTVTNRDTATGHVTGPYVYKPFPFSLFSLV